MFSHARCWHSPGTSTDPGTLASASAAAPKFQEGSKPAKHAVVIRGEEWASRGWPSNAIFAGHVISQKGDRVTAKSRIIGLWGLNPGSVSRNIWFIGSIARIKYFYAKNRDLGPIIWFEMDQSDRNSVICWLGVGTIPLQISLGRVWVH